MVINGRILARLARVGPHHKGTIVVLHLAMRFPFAGVIWQLLHHLIALRRLGFDVYYIEDHGAWVYDPLKQTPVRDPEHNVRFMSDVLERFGFADHWAFYDAETRDYLGLSRERCYDLLINADAIINLCAATSLRDEHRRNGCLIYLQTDPGILQMRLVQGDPAIREDVLAHHLHFTYALNIERPDCLLPGGGVHWRTTRPPVLIDQWQESSRVRDRGAFTTVCTWRNQDKDIELQGEIYHWSKDVTFRCFLDMPLRSHQQMEIATDLAAGKDYEKALAGGFTVVPAVPMSLDVDCYKRYIATSRGEFTTAKDVVARTNCGWFSDRSVCYLAAGRPVVTQSTGFEKFLPVDKGLFAFRTPEEGADAIRAINRDYGTHSRTAAAIAAEYFDATKVLGEVVAAAGL